MTANRFAAPCGLLALTVTACLGVSTQDLTSGRNALVLQRMAAARLDADGGNPSTADIAAARADLAGSIAQDCAVQRRNKAPDAGVCP